MRDHRPSWGLPAFLIAGLLVLAGCAALSVQEEEELGNEASSELAEELDFVEDEWVVEYVRDIGEKIVEAAKAANAHNFIVSLSDGYETQVGERGMRLSGGERQRIALARAFLKNAPILILDEPTNHLDIKAKEVLKGALQAFDGTLIVVSHDRDFLSGLTELVYEVTPNGLKQYIGDIKQFLHEKHATSIRAYESKKGETVAKTTASKPKEQPSEQKESYQERKQRERDERKLKNQVKKYESRVQEKEQALKEMDATMAEIDSNDRQKLTELAYQYEAVQQELNDAFEKWTEASERLEKINNSSH